MTVIAWDGSTLAADSQSECGGLTGKSTKLILIEQDEPVIAAICGALRSSLSIVNWLRAGGDPDKFPKLPDPDGATVAVLDSKGSILEYQGSEIAIREEMTPYAWGSGQDIAVGAMEAGADALEAVQIACRRNAGCGGPIVYVNPFISMEVLTLSERPVKIPSVFNHG